MRRWLLILILLSLGSLSTAAQNNTVAVRKAFTVEPLDGFKVSRGGNFNWSPDGAFVALGFYGTEDDTISYSQVYQVKTGTLIYQGAEFINWYADSKRMILRDYADSPPYIVDIYTRDVIARLEGANAIRYSRPIERFIINLDNDKTLRIYDAASGSLLFTLGNVDYYPGFSPDMTRMVVNIAETEVAVYETAHFTRQYSLPGYRGGGVWGPDNNRLTVTPLDSIYYKLNPLYIWTLGEGLSQPIYNITGSRMSSPDGTQIATVSDYTKVRFYDATTGELLNTIRGIPDAGPLELLHWDEEYLLLQAGSVSLNGFSVQIWNIDRNVFTFNQGVDFYSYRIIDNELVIHELPEARFTRVDLATGEVIDRTEADTEFSFSQVSPDWEWFLRPRYEFGEDVDASTPIDVYRREPLELVATLEHRDDPVNISWSPDSRHFISYADHSIIVWEIITDSVG